MQFKTIYFYDQSIDIKIKESQIRESDLISELKAGKSSTFWNAFPLLKLYFTFHTRLMRMETSSTDKSRQKGFSTFSDVYAQTISYGLLAVCWMSKEKKILFTRKNIQSLIPSTSEFLKNIFVELLEVKAGNEVRFCITELFSIWNQVNISAVFQKEDSDPVIYFYEDFLFAYGKDIKRSHGVYYTPDEIVDFIVRSTDEQLKQEFGLPLGLASTKTWNDVLNFLNQDKDPYSKIQAPELVKDTDVFIRILDPATGTGTFIRRVLEQIRNNLKEHWTSLGWSLKQMQGEWKAYVSGAKGAEKDYTGQGLLHRLHGFELMMTPYFIAHFRMGLFLQEDEELPFVFGEDERLNVFLTNSLEHPNDRGSDPLSNESYLADVIKRDTATTVVLGNPPYNGESKEKGAEITHLLEDYKKEPKGMVQLKEKNTKWINDDYVKFIRLSQKFVTTSQIGIISLITPHGFIENPTFRGMRWKLLSAFDSITILDLRGNARKREDDENIFGAIQQGVSINTFVLHKQANRLGDIYFSDIRGTALRKRDFLSKKNMKNIDWTAIQYPKNTTKMFLFRPIYASKSYEYTGFQLEDFFSVYSLGMLSKNDSITISYTEDTIRETVRNFQTMEVEVIRERYSLKRDSRDWKLYKAIEDVQRNHHERNFSKIQYRPFDQRWTYYTGKRGFFAYSQEKVMRHMKNCSNIALIVGRQGQVVGENLWNVAFITKQISDQNIFYRGGGTIFPAILCIDGVTQANFSEENLNKISFFDAEHTIESIEAKRERIFDVVYYIYAILYSIRYREAFSGYLDIGFPRIPYPKNAETFQQLAKKGKELRHIHLLEAPVFNNLSSKLRNKDGSYATTSQEITEII